MRDRHVLIGFFAIAVAVLVTLWSTSSRSVPAPSASAPQSTPASVPTATPAKVRAAGEAIVVHLDGLAGAAAFAQPGDSVDLFAFFPASGNGGHAVTHVLARDAAVLGTALSTPTDATLTVAVSPDQAVLVRAAEGLGARTFVVLRSSESANSETLESVTDSDLQSQLRRGS